MSVRIAFHESSIVELSAKRGLNNEIFPTAGLLTSNYNWQ